MLDEEREGKRREGKRREEKRREEKRRRGFNFVRHGPWRLVKYILQGKVNRNFSHSATADARYLNSLSLLFQA